MTSTINEESNCRNHSKTNDMDSNASLQSLTNKLESHVSLFAIESKNVELYLQNVLSSVTKCCNEKLIGNNSLASTNNDIDGDKNADNIYYLRNGQRRIRNNHHDHHHHDHDSRFELMNAAVAEDEKTCKPTRIIKKKRVMMIKTKSSNSLEKKKEMTMSSSSQANNIESSNQIRCKKIADFAQRLREKK